MGIIGSNFSKVGGTADKLHQLAASLMAAGSNQEGANSIIQQLQARQDRDTDEQRQALNEQYRRAQMAKMDRPQGVNLGNGGYGTYDPNNPDALNVIREPTAPPAPSSDKERLLDRWKSLPQGDPQRALIERILPGIQYTQPVMQAQQQGRMAVHQAPTYAGLHPRAGGGGGGGRTAATRVVGGKVYYKVNGGWYDNPEGN